MTLPQARTAGRFYYGWFMLPAAVALQVGTSPGQTYGVAVFNPALRESLDLTLQQLSEGYLLASLLAAAPMPLVGWCVDRFGLRRTGVAIVLLLGLACMAMSQARGLVSLTVGFFLLRAAGQGALSLVASNTLSMWFYRRLGFVSGISGLGVAGAIAVTPSLFLLLIRLFEWRVAYQVIGLGVWGVLLPLLWFVYRNRPEDVGQTLDGVTVEPDDLLLPKDDPPGSPLAQPPVQRIAEASLDLRGAWRSRAYWVMLGLTMLWGLVGTAIMFNLLPIFAAAGLSEQEAAGTFFTFAAAMATAQLIGGRLADQWPLNRLLTISVVGLLSGTLVLLVLPNIWWGHAYAVLFGGSQGLLSTVGNTLWARYFGREHLGKIRSSVTTAAVASCSLGPYLMGVSVDKLGSFTPALLLFAGALFLAAIAAPFATPPLGHSPGSPLAMDPEENLTQRR
ncbi:MFS transporter [Lignipirellula cremea]|uniref:Putative MFS-type transporter YhjX n=1 Tax=Lignipirellula cremea TaxID=2528010 RepID=A0A518E174_9BACT|nr:MFS transporter [Lignipirellula cremea]QDU97840.1 putative MFS-type transporter YhjX [Lignipirellula cremea]